MSGNSAPNYGPTGNAAGGFFDPSEVGPLEALDPSDNNNYDPDAVQDMILQFIAAHKKGMTEFQTEYLMWLMQEYGNQKIGLGAQTQTRMNGYFQGIQNLWDIINKAENGTPLADHSKNYTQEFENQIQTLENKLKGDQYFKDHPEMLQQIESNLDTLKSVISTPDPKNTSKIDNIVWMWKLYNGTDGNAVTHQGDSSGMSSIMRELGEANQQFTQVSQSVGTILQSDTKNQQSEMDSLNNFLKMLQTLAKSFIRNQTAGMA